MNVRPIQLYAGLALAAVHFAAAQGVTPPAAVPPGLEEGLRARVTEFYKLQQEGKFRASEKCVCEDTQDYYYNLGKKSPKSFRVTKVDFKEGFQTAIVQINVTADVAMMGGTFSVDAPVPSQWRQDNGTWCFYLTKDQQTNFQTPFGKAPIPQGGAQRESPSQPAVAAFRPVTVAEVMDGVKITADTVIIDATRPAAAEIELTNQLPGRVEASLSGLTPPGLTANFSAKEISSKQTVKLRFSYSPPATLPKPLYVLKLQFEPTRQVIPITIKFEHPNSPAEKTEKIAYPPTGTPKQ